MRASRLQTVADQFRGKLPKLGVRMDEAQNDVLPMMLRRNLWTSLSRVTPCIDAMLR